MEQTNLRLARLDDEQKATLHRLEQDLDAQILALEPQVTLLDLNGDQLERLRQAEKETGVILLAYKPQS